MIYFYKEGYPLYLPVSHSFSSCCFSSMKTVRFKFSNFRVIRGFVWTCPRRVFLALLAMTKEPLVDCVFCCWVTSWVKNHAAGFQTVRFPCVSCWVNYVARRGSKWEKLFKKLLALIVTLKGLPAYFRLIFKNDRGSKITGKRRQRLKIQNAFYTGSIEGKLLFIRFHVVKAVKVFIPRRNRNFSTLLPRRLMNVSLYAYA